MNEARIFEHQKEEEQENPPYIKCDSLVRIFKSGGIEVMALQGLDLEVQKIVSPEQWETNHMGEEGEFTYFFDAVHNKFAISSMETEMFDKLDTFDDMFKAVRKMRGFV